MRPPATLQSLARALRNRLLGRAGERAAERHLRREGMRVLVRNYSAAPGELDLIARDGDTLVFVEVKTRRAGVPAEAVTAEKQKRLTLTALHFLRRHRALEVKSRFDIVAIIWPPGARVPTIEHIRNAFEAVGRGQMFR